MRQSGLTQASTFRLSKLQQQLPKPGLGGDDPIFFVHLKSLRAIKESSRPGTSLTPEMESEMAMAPRREGLMESTTYTTA